MEKTTHHSISQVFFIVSGGLAIETMSFREEPYLTVTPTGAVELARLGLLDPVPEEIIDDKSKADPITKTLVCIQAGWFIVQCIARVAQHLPLSLLEIHTLAHVLVALSMYLFWYSKPYNALSPAVITKRDVVQAAALFKLSNQVLETASESRCLLSDELDLARVNAAHLRALSEKGQPTNDRQNLGAAAASDRQANDVNDILGVENQATESSTIRNDNDPSIMPGALAPGDVILQLTSNASTIQPIGQDGQPQQPKVSTSLPASEQISRNIEVHSRREHQPIYQFHGTNAPISEESSNISPKPHTSTRTENTLALAQLAIQRLKSHKVHFVYFQTPDKSIRHRSTYLVSAIADFIKTPGCQLNGAELATLRRSRPHKSMYDFLPSCPWSLLVYVLLVSYAGFHLSAWNTHFPTKNERIIWRAAGLLIVVWPLFAATIYCRAHYYAEPWAARQGAGYLALFVVGACRLYFLVEAFISLRGPAPRLYETVEWTQFWPHG